jgi:hypothetical protein
MFLLNKAVLMVTHNIQLLPHATQVILLDHKRSTYVGDFAGFARLSHPLAVSSRDTQRAQVAEGAELFHEAEATAASEGRDSPAKSKDEPIKLIEKETMLRGSVPFAIYKQYVEKSGAVLVIMGVFGGLILYNAFSVGTSWWLSFWADRSKSGEVGAMKGLSVYIIITFCGIGISIASIRRDWMVASRLAMREAGWSWLLSGGSACVAVRGSAPVVASAEAGWT